MDKINIPRRTRTLTTLCTLSMVNGVYGMVSGALNALATHDVDQSTIDSLYERLARFSVPIDGFNEARDAYYLNLVLNMGNLGAASFMCYGVSLVGVILMSRLRRPGFWLYISAQIGLAIVPAIFGGFNVVGQVTLGITLLWNALWIGLYATQLKHFVLR
jgi:hypothetical protein